MESLFRIAFWFILGGMIVMQAYFAFQVRLAREHMAADRQAIEREGRGCAVVPAIRRIPKEEEMMIEEFGDEYKTYMQRTGRLLPR